MLVVVLLLLIVVFFSSCDRTVPELPAPATPGGPAMRIGSVPGNAKLIKRVRPKLPAGAPKLMDPQVPVLLQIRIDDAGNVTEVRPVSVAADARIQRDPTLIKAAEDAVKQWKYEPTLLNGQPIAVIATVTVTFPDR